MAAGSAAVLSSFIINLCVFFGCFTAFSFLRIQQWSKRFFAARRYANDIEHKPRRLPLGLIGWIWPVVTYPEPELISEAGLDCAIYLRILRFGVIHAFVVSLFCLVLILPLNLTSNAIDEILAEQAASNDTDATSANLKFTNFDRYSLANVPAGSPKMWGHMVAVYVVVLYTLWLLRRFNWESVLLRLIFLGNSKRGGPSHTVLVTDIPGVRDAVAKELRQEAKARKSPRRQKSGSSSTELLEKPVQTESTSLRPSSSRAQILPEERTASGAALAAADAKAPPTPAGATAAAGLPGQPLSPRQDDGGQQDMMSAAARKEESPKQPSKDGRSADGEGKTENPLFAENKPGSGSAYTLTADVDPQYEATGGKLEVEIVGMSKEAILKALEADEVPGNAASTSQVSCVPLQATDQQHYAHFAYDLTSPVWNAEAMAKEKLKSGLTPQQLVAREFAMVYQPQNIAAVNMAQDTRALEPLVTEYNKVAQQLEDYLNMAKLRMKLREKMDPKKMLVLRAFYGDWEYLKQFPGKVFAKVDAVDFWLARLRFLADRIKHKQVKAARKLAPSAFVTFNTRMCQAVGSTSLHHHDETAWRVQNAPAPFEVVWGNLSMMHTEKKGRLYILWVVFWLMTLFFMIPVAAIQAMIEVPKLATIPVLGDIVTAPVVKQLLEAIIPGLALKIFLAVVPIILRFMALLSGATSLYEIDFGVVKRYFLFQVVVVFFGSVIAGSFFNQLKEWIRDPSSVVSTLGKSIPMSATFFITYLLVNGLGVKSIAFLRAVDFVIFWILSKFSGSPSARQRLWMYQYTNNGTTVVDHTIAMLLLLTFSCINPIVCPAALGYFLVSFLGESYNNIYVFRREYESAGKLWQTVNNQVMVGLYIMQLTMLGLLAIKKFPFSPLIIPLLLLSVGFHISTLRMLKRPWSVTALHNAAYMDMLDASNRRMALLSAARAERKERRERLRKEGAVDGDPQQTKPLIPGDAEKLLLESLNGDGFAMTQEEKEKISDLYRNPVFKVPLEDLERLSKLATDVVDRLPRLNEYAKEYRRYKKKMKKEKGDATSPPPVPQELTMFDEDRSLVDCDDDDSAPAENGSSGMPAGRTSPDKEAKAEGAVLQDNLGETRV